MTTNREEQTVYESGFDLVEDAQRFGITKAKFAELLNLAWDQARKDQLNKERSTEIIVDTLS